MWTKKGLIPMSTPESMSLAMTIATQGRPEGVVGGIYLNKKINVERVVGIYIYTSQRSGEVNEL
jgi:hypothetical protein